MFDETAGLGDTDQALGMDEATWSSGLDQHADTGAEEIGPLGEAAATDRAAEAPLPEHSEAPVVEADVSALPMELTFGAMLTPEDKPTQDSYAEKYAWSTDKQAYVGLQTGREIDEYTGTEKK